MQVLIHLHVNTTNFHIKGFALGLALKQRRKATRKRAIFLNLNRCFFYYYFINADQKRAKWTFEKPENKRQVNGRGLSNTFVSYYFEVF